MKTLFLTLNFVFIVSFSFSQKDENSLLYEITGNGLTKPSYLYGTMHVSQKIAFYLTDEFFKAFNSCNMVSMESNPETMLQEWLKEMKESTLYDGYADYTRSSYNQKDLYNSFAVYPPSINDYRFLISADHRLLNGLLYRYDNLYSSRDFQENTYLDLFLYQAANKTGKKCAYLENPDTTFRFYLLSMVRDEEEKNIDYKELFDGKTPNEILEDAYRRGDLKLIDSLTRISSSQNSIKYMLVERNKIMVAEMIKLMKSNTLFTGVGVAHLPGKDGLISLLRQHGYNVKAVIGKVSKKSSSQMEKIKQTFIFPILQSQTTPDGFITVELPSSLIQLPSQADFKSYVSPDIVNGAYYSITRKSIYGSIFKRSQQDLMRSIDSVLYELIPGKILSKNIITESGFPGLEIFNKTLSGDYQRIKIFVTPMEIIVFKIIGIGSYAESKEALKSLNSFKFHIEKIWKEYNLPNSGLSLNLPANAIIGNFTEEWDKISESKKIQSFDYSDSSYFLSMKEILNDFNYIEEDTFELNIIAEKYAKQLKFKLCDRKFEQFKNLPTLSFKMINSDSTITIYNKVVICGPHYYLFSVVSSNKEKLDRFFNDIKFIPLLNDGKPLFFSDTI